MSRYCHFSQARLLLLFKTRQRMHKHFNSPQKNMLFQKYSSFIPLFWRTRNQSPSFEGVGGGRGLNELELGKNKRCRSFVLLLVDGDGGQAQVVFREGCH